MSRAYYNEHNAFAVEWLRNLIDEGLIAPGDVDDRDIRDVEPGDLKGYTQCHFFAGIGGWSHALHLAGWPDNRPVWTGSCPCQPFSTAKRGRARPELDLWPEWLRLISDCKPDHVYGEQVPNAHWIDRTADDMEALGYTIRAEVRPAFSVGADHQRQRLFFACHAHGHGKPELPVDVEVARLPWSERDPKPVPAEDGLPGRMGVLHAYGNAIVPQVAAEFVRASIF